MPSAAAQLKDWIQRRQFRQNEAAEALGIHESLLSMLVNGKRTPGWITAVKIERATGIPSNLWLSSTDVARVKRRSRTAA